MLEFILTVAVGFLSGVLSGMFGIGGAVITTPAIRVLGATTFQAIGSTLPSILPSSISGSIRYNREHLIRGRIMLITAAFGVPASVVGSRLSRSVPGNGHWLMIATAAFVGFTAYRTAFPIVRADGSSGPLTELRDAWWHLALIGIRRRGVPLAQRIAQAMRGIDGVDVPVGTLDITLYRDDLSKVAPQAVLQSSDIPFGVDGMDLVLVDDVLYTGRTIRAAMNGLFDLGRPQRVSLCVLIDRGHREMPIEAQFVGRTVQTSDTEIIEVRLREIDPEERVVLVDRQEQ